MLQGDNTEMQITNNNNCKITLVITCHTTNSNVVITAIMIQVFG